MVSRVLPSLSVACAEVASTACHSTPCPGNSTVGYQTLWASERINSPLAGSPVPCTTPRENNPRIEGRRIPSPATKASCTRTGKPGNSMIFALQIKTGRLVTTCCFEVKGLHCATISGICRNPNQISSCITPASLLLIEISTVCTNFRYQSDDDHSLASCSTVQTHALTKVYQRLRCRSSRSASACLSRTVLSGLLR